MYLRINLVLLVAGASPLTSSDLLGWASIHPFLRLETVSPSSWVKVWSNNKFEKLLKGCLSFTLKFLHCDSIQIFCWGGLTLEKNWAGRRPTLPLSLFVEIEGSDSAIMNRIPPAQACYFRPTPSSRRWPSTCLYSACHWSSPCSGLLVLRFAWNIDVQIQ